MESVNLPKGLIRYASEDEIEKKAPFKFTARMKGYTAVLAILLGILIGLMFLRTDVDATILRLPGQLFQHNGENISNIYTYKIVNKTENDFNDIHFELISHEGVIKKVGNQHFRLKKQEISQGTFFIEIKQSHLTSDKTELQIGVFDGKKILQTTKTNFLGPRTFN